MPAVPLAAGLLVVVSLSPVRGPGPRATRIEGIGATWGQRLRVAVLLTDASAAKEDAALSEAAARRAGLEAWRVPPSVTADGKYSQFLALKFAVERAVRDASVRWLFWCNDHTFVVAENLAAFVRSYGDVSEPLYLGSRLWGPCCGVFNSGAAGFALNRRALETLVRAWDPQQKKAPRACDATSRKAHVATCLAAFECHARDTRDAQGAERFHVYGPVRLATGALDQWYIDKKRRVVDESQRPSGGKQGAPPHPRAGGAPEEEAVVVATGVAGVAADVVSFHYVAAEEARLVDALIHASHSVAPPYAGKTTLLGDAWPSGLASLGGYAHPFPTRSPPRAALVAALLDKIRLTSGDPRETTAGDGASRAS